MVEKEKRYEIVDEVLYQNVNEFGFTAEQIAERTATVPTFELKNCVVKFSNISTSPAKAGKANSLGIQLIVDETCDLIQEDKNMIAKLSEIWMEQDGVDVNDEDEVKAYQYKGIFNKITAKLIRDGKFDEKFLGKYAVSFNSANKPQNPKLEENLVDEETGEIYDKMTTMFFAVKDRLTGEAIKPKIVKVVNGVETETFVNPKTGETTGHYISGGDIVNVTIRPYEFENSKDATRTLKYNPLKIEIVSSSFDRSGGSSRTASQAPTSNLGSLFGKVTKVAPKKPEYATEAVQETKPKATKAIKEETVTQSQADALDELDDLLG